LFSLLNEHVILEANKACTPEIEALLAKDQNVWGPRYVVVSVRGPNVEVEETVGNWEDWQEAWGPFLDFHVIARNKRETTLRVGLPTGQILANCPWCFERGDYFYRGGYTEPNSELGVGVSGANEDTDEAIARLVYQKIVELSVLAISTLKKDGIDHL